jgi:hypothetical protein
LGRYFEVLGFCICVREVFVCEISWVESFRVRGFGKGSVGAFYACWLVWWCPYHCPFSLFCFVADPWAPNAVVQSTLK